jgi:hypothetical protein
MGGGLQRDIAGQDHYGNTAPANRLADCDLERARHLLFD